MLAGEVGFEPTTERLTAAHSTTELLSNELYRDSWIRTNDFLLPKQMRYQTALYPEKPKNYGAGGEIRTHDEVTLPAYKAGAIDH